LLALAAGCSSENSSKNSRTTLANPGVATDGSNVPTQQLAVVSADPKAIVAKVNNVPITVGDIYRPMMEAYGLQFMLHLTQLELARQRGTAMGIKVEPQDIAAERQRTVETAFK
jgi:hypothetical protein